MRTIEATFRNRETQSQRESSRPLTTGFAERHRAQWKALVRKMGAREHEEAFVKIVSDPKLFVTPLLDSLTSGEQLTQVWEPDYGWIRS